MKNTPRRRLVLAAATILATACTLLVGSSGSQALTISSARWVGTWSAAPTAAGSGFSKTGFADQTLRMIVHTSIGGEGLRVRLSNAFGTQAVTIGHVAVGLPSAPGSADVVAGSTHAATFGGQSSVTIPRGGQVFTDPIAMTVPADRDLTVSVYFPTGTGPATWHITARETSYYGAGDHVTDTSGAALDTTSTSWFFVTGVDVLNRTATGSIVVLGDSISDGLTATVNADHRWPDRLADRLDNQRLGIFAPGILNAGIAGDMYGHDGSDIGFPELGVNASARFDRDVVGQAGVRTVILQLGINDIWIFHDSAATIISEIRQTAIDAHERGLRIVVCTLSPWQGYSAWTPDLDAIRLAVNGYIRSSSDFDGVIDFDAVLRDPTQPTRLRPDWDSGDHIHPNDIGFQAMADAVPLGLLL